jgi:hypothetical protein
MTPCILLILLTIFKNSRYHSYAYFLSMPTKAPKNAGLRSLGVSFAQRYPQFLCALLFDAFLTYFRETFIRIRADSQ